MMQTGLLPVPLPSVGPQQFLGPLLLKRCGWSAACKRGAAPGGEPAETPISQNGLSCGTRLPWSPGLASRQGSGSADASGQRSGSGDTPLRAGVRVWRCLRAGVRVWRHPLQGRGQGLEMLQGRGQGLEIPPSGQRSGSGDSHLSPVQRSHQKGLGVAGGPIP